MNRSPITRLASLLVLSFGLNGSTLYAADAKPFPALTLTPPPAPSPLIQRTMRRLATSTPTHRETVRILFYGQSITEQKWVEQVVSHLKQTYPHANILAENRSLGGFSSQLLVKTAESDLYSFSPDLLVFHVYGSHINYEEIIRHTRERTSAEILIQTDHVVRPTDFDEETDAAKLPPAGKHWDAFMNHNWLPKVARDNQAALCDQRAMWKIYLRANSLQPKDLLRDTVHLNAYGEFLMAECVKKCLVYDSTLKTAPADAWVTTYPRSELTINNGALALKFVGNRIDLVRKVGSTGSIEIGVDNTAPSKLPGSIVFTRALSKPGNKWPVVAGFGSKMLPVVESWSMVLSRDPANPKRYTFTVAGSVTGPDGEGSTDQPFVSKSGRIAILPEHWNIEYALQLAQVKPIPDRLNVSWQAVLLGRDTLGELPKPAPGVESVETVVQGIAPGQHELKLRGSLDQLEAIRVYRPAERSPRK